MLYYELDSGYISDYSYEYPDMLAGDHDDVPLDQLLDGLPR